ncbi:hypothetical protein FB451DRAFT_1556999 [Mycena latifolia]|nr:hypothetical protein FB451DRAFT_1556999 [Mycena latifolia]
MAESRHQRAARATNHERALALLTLLNPMHEDACCVFGMSSLLEKIFAHKATADDPRQAPILRASMSFLSSPRSDGEHAALRERLTRVDCKQRSRFRHAPVSRPPAEVLELVLMDMCAAISDYLLQLGADKLRKEKPTASQDDQPWPSRVSDVIPTPGGELELLTALVQWAAKVPGGHSLFLVIGALARFWEPFTQEVLRVPSVFALATQHLQHALDAYKAGIDLAAQMYASFISPIISIAQGLFFAILETDMAATIGLLPPIYESMYTIALEIEPILLGMKFTVGLDDCRRWFHFVRRLRKAINPDGTFITAAQVDQLPPETDRRTSFAVAFHRMVEVRNRNQCLNIACTSKIVARSSICSRCGIVRYCSPECLKAAWAAEELPHKSLCTAIKALRTVTGLLDNTAWNATVRDTSMHRSPETFALLCAARNADEDVAEAVFQGISYLTFAKMRFSHQTALEGSVPEPTASERIAGASSHDGESTASK